jgi:hypothetical protein
VAVVSTLATGLLLSLTAQGAVSARPDHSEAASTRLNPAYHVVHQWRDVGTSGVLACLGDRTAAQATAAMTAAMRQARTQALAEHADLRSATHAAARTSLVLVARQAYTSCRENIEPVAQSAYADAMRQLADRPSIWRGAALGDLAARRQLDGS